jgi:general secretion pathway protein K
MRDDRGFALVTVLWTLVLLTLLAGMLMQSARISASLERNAWHRMQAEAAAETGFTKSILSLLDPDAKKRWPIDGREVHITGNGLPLIITIQDELGRIDINTAPREVLAALFASAGGRQAPVEALVESILSWRQGDTDNRRANSDGTRASQPVMRRNLFRNVSELKSLPGMTNELFERIRPAVTVHSRRATIDPVTAPRQALLALPGATAESVQRIMRERDAADSGTGQATTPLSGRAFKISIIVQQNGNNVHLERTVRLLPQGTPVYWLLQDRQ